MPRLTACAYNVRVNHRYMHDEATIREQAKRLVRLRGRGVADSRARARGSSLETLVSRRSHSAENLTGDLAGIFVVRTVHRADVKRKRDVASTPRGDVAG